jgi:hypothetical protein
MTSKKVHLLVEKVFEQSGLGNWFKKESKLINESTRIIDDKFIIESIGNVVPLSFNSIQIKDVSPFDIIINKAGKMFNVDCIELNEGNVTVVLSDENNNELVETYSSEHIFGYVDTLKENETNEFGDAIEIYEDSKKKVKLNKIMHGDVKKYKVYVKNDKGNIVKVNFGDPNMEIKRDNPARRRNFRARHHCENPGPRWKAKYWACRTWSSQSVSSMLKENNEPFKKKAVNEEIINNTVQSFQNLEYNPNLWGHLNDSK